MKETKRLVPKRRFKEFENSGKWELCKLKDVAIFSKGKGYSKNDLEETGTPIILYGHLYTKYQTVIDVVDSFAADKENSIYSTGKEVIVPSSGETAEDIARASVVAREGIILGGDLNIISISDDNNLMFLALSISNGNTQKELVKRAQGKSVVHLYNTDLQEVDYCYPTKSEQAKIGQFFQQLDNLISLQQEKIRKTKALKSAYLSDMFPKEGEKYPKLRFEGFTEPWEEKKINEVTNYASSSFSIENAKEIGKYRLFDANSLIGYVDNNVQTKDYITIIKDGAGVGRVRLLQKNTAFIGTMGAIISGEKTDINFMYSFLKIFDFSQYTTGSTIPHIYYKDYGNAVIYCPSYEEQAKIGQFFQQLDKQITLHEKKLEKLENLKKAYLNEMFV